MVFIPLAIEKINPNSSRVSDSLLPSFRLANKSEATWQMLGGIHLKLFFLMFYFSLVLMNLFDSRSRLMVLNPLEIFELTEVESPQNRPNGEEKAQEWRDSRLPTSLSSDLMSWFMLKSFISLQLFLNLKSCLHVCRIKSFSSSSFSQFIVHNNSCLGPLSKYLSQLCIILRKYQFPTNCHSKVFTSIS